MSQSKEILREMHGHIRSCENPDAIDPVTATLMWLVTPSDPFVSKMKKDLL